MRKFSSRLIIIQLLLFYVFCKAGAQTTTYLPLQPHKLHEARQLYREGVAQHDSLKIAESYYAYAMLTMPAGDLVTAKRWFLKSLRIQESRGDTYERARLHVRLGDLAMTQLNYPECLQHAYQALAIARRSGSNKALIRSYALLSRVHEWDWAAIGTKSTQVVTRSWPPANPDSSLYYLRKVEYLAYRLNDPMEVAHIDQEIGHRLLDRRDPRSIAYLLRAMTIADSMNASDQTGMIMSVFKAYLAFGQPTKARHYLEKVSQLYKRQPVTVDQLRNLEEIQIAYHKAVGNWREALRHTEAYHQLQINELIADREGAVSRLSVEYETAKKEARLKQQQQQLALRTESLRNGYLFMAALALLLLGAVGASVVFYRLNRANKRISQQNALLVQEQSHRTKNHIQFLSDLIDRPLADVSDPGIRLAVEESQSRLSMMAALQRRLYDGPALATVELADFLEDIVWDTLSAFGCDHVEPDLSVAARPVPANTALYIGLLVHELVANACKHAFQDNPAPRLMVRCQLQNARRPNGALVLTIADNGAAGDEPEGNTLSGSVVEAVAPSFGMKLIQTQVAQLRGTATWTYANGTQFQLIFTPPVV